MMEDILDRLFYGEVSPYDDSVEDIETFRELNHKVAELWSQVESLASPELMELLNLYKVHRADLEMLMQKDRFKVQGRFSPGHTASDRSDRGYEKPGIKYTICPNLRAKPCVQYASNITCYISDVERICVLPKGKTHKKRRKTP